jgi:YVTN family beta-propeller protein
VISTADNSQLTSPIPVGSNPVGIVMQNDGAFAYVLNQGSGTVTVINTANDSVDRTLPVGSNPTQILWNEGLKRVYVLNSGSGTVDIFNAGNYPQTKLATVPTQGTNSLSVAALPDGSRFYVANQGSNNVTVFDAHSYQLRKTIAVGISPVSIAASGDSTKVFVANQGTTGIAVGQPGFDPGSTTIIKTLDDSIPLSMAPPANSPHPSFVTAS